MNIGSTFGVRPAVLTDQRQIEKLLLVSSHIHRHLDWRNPLDYIGSSPFYVLETHGEIVAALGCPPDPSSVVWMRLFVSADKIPVHESWSLIWETAKAELEDKGKYLTVAIVMQTWFEDLLLTSGFNCHQFIVMFERDGGPVQEKGFPKDMIIRSMMPFDLPDVAKVDGSAFEPLWQNTLPVLERAYPQAIWPAVAEMEGRVIGYQLSTRNSHGIHLARLAVLPPMQGKGLGYTLVSDLIKQANNQGLHHLTVNTQSNNDSSLRLYQKMGFSETGEKYPVYTMQVSK
jgi:ribosomal protein S18 acetylase RimI-like enzyme